MTGSSADFTARLDSVATRLQAQVAADFPADARTSPDPPTGERWVAGQVWAHLAEFIPYWIDQAELVIGGHGSGEPVPFGRTKSDPGRLAAIERDRHADQRRLGDSVLGDISTLRAFLAGIDSDAWSARGLHPTLGEMDLSRLVEEFLVGHLEQHADQLDQLATQPA